MRTITRRTKKLIVAFHFQSSDQAAWKCDICRRSGLDKKRKCGWLNQGAVESGGPIVWAAPGIVLDTCPKSYISAESLTTLEVFSARKLLGAKPVEECPARLVDGLCVLEAEVLRKENHGE